MQVFNIGTFVGSNGVIVNGGQVKPISGVALSLPWK